MAAWAGSDCGTAAVKADQQSAVVLRLLKLMTVSPQPPSSFWCALSQSRPDRMRPEWPLPQRRSESVRATTAVAVESALLARRPSQPAGRLPAFEQTPGECVRWSGRGRPHQRSCRGRDGQVPEGQQSVVGVFAVERVVQPASVEAAAVRPQRVDEVQAGFVNAVQRDVQGCESVQRRSQSRADPEPEPTASPESRRSNDTGPAARHSRCGSIGASESPEQHRGRSSHGRDTVWLARSVRVSAIARTQTLKRTSARRSGSGQWVRADPDRRPMRGKDRYSARRIRHPGLRCDFQPAIESAILGSSAWIARDVGPAACEAGTDGRSRDPSPSSNCRRKRRDRVGRERFVKRDQGFETEDRVIEIARRRRGPETRRRD